MKILINSFALRQMILLLMLCPATVALAQHTYIPTGGNSDYILDRLEIKSGELANSAFHTTLKSYRRKAIATYIDSFPVNEIPLSRVDYFNMSYLTNDNFEWTNQVTTATRKPLFGQFFQRKAAFYSVQEKDFNLVVNPVLYYSRSTDAYNGTPFLLNNRGVEIRGNVGDRIGFYTQISDELLQPNSWVGNRYYTDKTLMYANFVKGYSQGTTNYFGYFVSSGYVTASLNRYMDLQFGHTRNFIGDGYRTFILGNNQTEYLNMRLNTRIWKMNYTNIWAELRDLKTGAYSIQNRHFMATHHLSLNLGKQFNLGVFETILFQRDSGYGGGGFDLNYLNPIIFYKSVENMMNSTDKAIMGMNFKWNFKRHVSFYGQFVISEMVLKEMIARNGWWGNKFAAQAGVKYIDVAGVNNLDLQLEFNVARPYMYTSFSTLQTFSNFGQYMAHPLGANFYEGVSVIRYQPINRLLITNRFIFAMYGNDTGSSNYGSDPRQSYNSRVKEYGNYVGQGIQTRLIYNELMATWMIFHNIFVDAKAGARITQSDMKIFQTQVNYFSLGIRMNINDRRYDF